MDCSNSEGRSVGGGLVRKELNDSWCFRSAYNLLASRLKALYALVLVNYLMRRHFVRCSLWMRKLKQPGEVISSKPWCYEVCRGEIWTQACLLGEPISTTQTFCLWEQMKGSAVKIGFVFYFLSHSKVDLKAPHMSRAMPEKVSRVWRWDRCFRLGKQVFVGYKAGLFGAELEDVSGDQLGGQTETLWKVSNAKKNCWVLMC